MSSTGCLGLMRTTRPCPYGWAKRIPTRRLNLQPFAKGRCKVLFPGSVLSVNVQQPFKATVVLELLSVAGDLLARQVKR